jgi:hypothetical protein
VPSTQDRFETFHAANPQVYKALVTLARKAKARGKTRVGIKALVEVVRWELSLETAGDFEFKVNNSHAPHFARLIMAQEPDLAGIFETRRSTADHDCAADHEYDLAGIELDDYPWMRSA